MDCIATYREVFNRYVRCGHIAGCHTDVDSKRSDRAARKEAFSENARIMGIDIVVFLWFCRDRRRCSDGSRYGFDVGVLNVVDLSPFSLGYVNFLQRVCLALTSVPMAQLGVRMAHRIPAIILKRIFAFVMVYMSLKMMGIL